MSPASTSVLVNGYMRTYSDVEMLQEKEHKYWNSASVVACFLSVLIIPAGTMATACPF